MLQGMADSKQIMLNPSDMQSILKTCNWEYLSSYEFKKNASWVLLRILGGGDAPVGC